MRRGIYKLALLPFIALAPLAYLAFSSIPAHAAARSCGARAAELGSSSQPSMSNTARITLSRDRGSSGTVIRVSGTGWPAKAQIIIDFVDTSEQIIGGEGIAQATTDAAGAFRSPEFQAPKAHCGVSPGAGTMSLVVAHTGDGAVKAQARFTFVASPELSTDLLFDLLTIRSTQIPVSGHSWGAGTLVTLYATQEQHIDHIYSIVRISGAFSVEARADASGSFQATVLLPAGLLPAINVSVAATATNPLYGSLTRDLSRTFLVTPETYPSVTLSAAAVARGGVLTITGDHWRRGDTVSVESCLGLPEPNRQSILGCNLGGPPTLLAQLPIGDDGRFVVKAPISKQARLGSTVVRIYANDASLQWYDVTLAVKIVDAQADDGASILGMHAPSLGTAGTTLAAGTLALLLCGGLGAGYFVWRRRRFQGSVNSGPSGGVDQSGGADGERPAD